MVITVQCPSCATSFPVDTNKVPVGGVNARCSVCSGIFRVERPEHTLPSPLMTEIPPVEEAEAATPLPEVEEEPEAEAAAPPPEVEKEPEVEEAEAAAPLPEVEEEPEAIHSPEDWIFETEPEVQLDELDIPPLSTVERSVPQAQRGPDSTPVTEGLETQDSLMEDLGLGGDLDLDLVPEDITVEPVAADIGEPAPVEPMTADLSGVVPSEEAQAPEEAQDAGAPKGFTLEKRDPSEKAQRLARVLVSDMIMYNPQRHQRALDNETLEEDFADEITKSWNEYVDQVGEELARETSFWTDALNEILAKGQKVF
jgi:predicted Zn finger-like uncharacterized protein